MSLDPFENNIAEPHKMLTLPNLGNSCYINSVMQIFLNSTTLFNTLKCTFDNFSLEMIRDLYCKTNNISTFEQCDALLFLSFILDKIEVRLKDKSIDCSNLWRQKWCSRYKCKNCKKCVDVTQIENFWFIYPVDNSTENLLEMDQCILNNVRTTVTKNCENCSPKQSVDFSRTQQLSNAPTNLFINLQYFQAAKINIYTSLSLSIGNNYEADYDLKGVIVHSGTETFGHYKVYICIDDEWWLFNDTIVTKVYQDIENILRNKYITTPLLWYERNFDSGLT